MVTFGGKTVEQALFDQAAASMGATAPVDPIGKVTGTQEHIISVFADETMWLDHLLAEMSAIARKQWRLSMKLKDPGLQQHPKKGSAVARHRQYTADLLDYADRIAQLEASCDRHWHAMDATSRFFNERGWVNTERLIGQAWTVRSRQQQWPVAYCVEVAMFHTLDGYLRRELETAIGTEPILLGKEPPF